MKYIDHSGRVDLSKWYFELDAFNEAVEREFKEAIEVALKELLTETDVYFPIEWNFSKYGDDGIGGPPINDPLRIYMRVPFDSGIDELPAWGFSLNNVIDDYIEGSAGIMECDADDKMVNKNAQQMADAFRRLADKLERHIAANIKLHKESGGARK